MVNTTCPVCVCACVKDSDCTPYAAPAVPSYPLQTLTLGMLPTELQMGTSKTNLSMPLTMPAANQVSRNLTAGKLLPLSQLFGCKEKWSISHASGNDV